MAAKISRLQVSGNGRFLVQEDGAPFFYLGDTAWLLFHRVGLEQVEFYLANRAEKRFTVIQAAVLPVIRGLDVPNVNGDVPLIEDDPTRPNEPYFRHVDVVLEMAARYGLYVGLAPTWAPYVVGDRGRAIFDTGNAYVYGRFIGERYRGMDHIIWIMGGDRPPIFRGKDYTPVWRAMARGVREGSGGQNLMTWHPQGGGHSSSLWFHADDWLDFNMMQTGPRRNFPNHVRIAMDYRLEPVKPTLDGEPGYERALHRQNPANPRLTAHDVRKYAYWALFAGACGHTYGGLEVWQMFSDSCPPANGAELPWVEALDLPGAGQMQYVRQLIESRPFLTRIPDQSLLATDPGYGGDHVQATRGSDGSYAFLYVPTGKPVRVNLDTLSGDRLIAHWYDPRLGTATLIGEVPGQGTHEFAPPTCGPEEDWVLVLDAVSQGYPVPGAGDFTTQSERDLTCIVERGTTLLDGPAPGRGPGGGEASEGLRENHQEVRLPMRGRIWRGGMIGAGFWSEIQLTAWAGVENAEIVALCDRHPERLEPRARRFGIPRTFADLGAMLDEAQLDFLDICVRPYSHARLTKLAADRGLPVLCQKPFCTSMEEARDVVEYCRQAGVRLMINDNYRWRAWYRRAREVLDSGALGEPFLAMIHGRYRSTLPKFHSPQTYFAEMPRLAVYEMGVHYLDTLRFLFGEPDTVFARLHHVSPQVVGEDVQVLTLGYSDLTCLVMNSWASVPVPGVDRIEGSRWRAPRFEIDGTKGTLALTADASMHLVTDTDRKCWQFHQDIESESCVSTQHHFIDCLESGAEFETSGTETLKTMALVYACYLSVEEERVVRQTEFLK